MKNLTSTGLRIFETYLSQKDSLNRPVENPNDLFHRVSRNIAKAETKWSSLDEVDYYQEEYYRMMNRGEFIPSIPVMRHAGQEKSILVDSFVVSIPDNIDGISKAIQAIRQIHQFGGEMGFSFSDLRPKNDLANSGGGQAGGALEILKVVYDALQAQLEQFKWPTTHMVTLRLDHPEIFDFLELRRRGECPNLKFAAGVTSHFMRCLKKGTTYPLVNPRTGKIIEFVPARKIYEKLCQVGREQGLSLIFLDEINRHQSTPHLGRIEAASAGGAQPLLSNEGAALGVMNLGGLVQEQSFDEERFEIIVDLAVRFLDNVVELSIFPDAATQKMTRDNRKLGLGMIGFADLLEKLNIPYDSLKARNFGTYLMKLFFKRSRQASMALAKQRGVFANFTSSTFEKGKGNMLRNASLLTLADHTSLAEFAGVSVGINPKANSKISPHDEIKMQAILQKYTDNSVSKQIGIQGLQEKEVGEFFMEAYESKCKVITVFQPEPPAVPRAASRQTSTLGLARSKAEEGARLQKGSESPGFVL